MLNKDCFEIRQLKETESIFNFSVFFVFLHHMVKVVDRTLGSK